MAMVQDGVDALFIALLGEKSIGTYVPLVPRVPRPMPMGMDRCTIFLSLSLHRQIIRKSFARLTLTMCVRPAVLKTATMKRTWTIKVTPTPVGPGMGGGGGGFEAQQSRVWCMLLLEPTLRAHGTFWERDGTM